MAGHADLLRTPSAASWIAYGPQTFLIEKIHKWEQKNVYSEDGVQRLLVHHVIGVESVWNPKATRSDDNGRIGADSIARVRENTLAPRQLLTVTIGGKVVLQAPVNKNDNGGRYDCDARWGPAPICLNLIRFMGTKTVVAYFEIECWVPVDCPSNRVSVLAHRFEMSHDYDDEGYCTRTINGTAVFRRDLLEDQNLVPDDFRARLFHPVPFRFKREAVRVSEASDGTSVRYTIKDVQQPATIIPMLSDVVDAEAFKYKQNLEAGRWAHQIVKLEGTWKDGYNQAGYTDIPKFWVSLTIRATAAPTAQKVWAIRACFQAAAAFGFASTSKPTAYYRGDLTVDLFRKVATLEVGMYLSGAVGSLGSAVFNRKPDNTHKDLFGKNKFPDEIRGLTSVGPFAVAPALPYKGARGTPIEGLVAQALLGNCDLIPEIAGFTRPARNARF
jgi:hypothetical protein